MKKFLKIAALPATMYLGHSAFMGSAENKPLPEIKSKNSLVNKYVT